MTEVKTQKKAKLAWSFVTKSLPAGLWWKLLKNYSDNQSVWDFRANGKLIEQIAGEHQNITKYYFCPEKSLLSVDRSDYADDGYMLACIEERYRVEFLSDRYMILYDLDEVNVEPDDYTFMVELERL